jgi:teichuronic acid exporter
VAAPWMADFFHNPALRLVVIVNSTGFMIMALQTVPQGLLQRDLDYRRLSLAEAVQAFLQALFTVLAALLGYGYWSLVIAALVARTANTALLLWWKPTGFAWPRWVEIVKPLHFGSQVAVARVANAIYSQLDAILIGRFLGDHALGIYRLALNLASAPAEKIGFLLMRVTGPFFARLQTDPVQMRRYFFGISEGLAFSIIPLVCGMAALAPLIVTVFFGQQWLPAAPAVQFLALFMAIRSFTSLMQQVLTSLRHTRFLLNMSLLSFVLMPVLFYFLVPHGIGAISSAWLLATPLTSLPILAVLARRLDFSLVAYVKEIFPSLLAVGVMVGVVFSLQAVLPAHWPNSLRLGLLIATGGLVYAAILWFGFQSRIRRFIDLFRRLRSPGSAPAVSLESCEPNHPPPQK